MNIYVYIYICIYIYIYITQSGLWNQFLGREITENIPEPSFLHIFEGSSGRVRGEFGTGSKEFRGSSGSMF